MEVGTEKSPSQGEVLIVTVGAGFLVKGTMQDIASKLAGEDWPSFELVETGDKVIIRSSQVVALREGTKPRRTSIGLTPH